MGNKVAKHLDIKTTRYINEETGEVEEFTTLKKELDSDFGFHKVWLADVLSVLDTFGNKKLKILLYLLKNMRNEDNSISTNYRKISDDLKVAYSTVALTMQELIANNVIKKLMTNTYTFNPSLLVKGGSSKKRRLLIEYNTPDSKKLKDVSDDEVSDSVSQYIENQSELDI